MRRKDREIQDMAEIMDIVRRENVCFVAFHDEPCPYLVPMNYGAQMEEGKLVLYFHGAKEGTKLEKLRGNPRVAYSLFTGKDVRLNMGQACASTAGFESVCGTGTAKLLETDGEKRHGLAVIMNHIGAPQGAAFDAAAFPAPNVQAVAVWKIVTETVTGKRHE